MTAQEQALQGLLRVLRKTGEGNPRVHQLAVQWPSLAAALGNLVLAYDMQPDPSLRRAAAVVRADACVCGHGFEDHGEYRCAECMCLAYTTREDS